VSGGNGAFPYRLFEAVGLEVEYMLVDRESLAVRPIADALLCAEAGSPETEIERGELAWSNELALHVIELKTNGPRRELAGLADALQREVRHINAKLEPLGAMLMPTGMHPWMDPGRETRLWPHEHGPVYEAFDRIFGCGGHGWSNLQSVHLNLPFGDAAEFGRLHAAIRFALPLLPALAASSPLCEGRPSGWLDTRLDHYRRNSARVPSVAGRVVPEAVFTPQAYRRDLLGKIYADLAPLDPDGVLRNEWVNARGAIARFERGALEIRVLDCAECPRADLAIAQAVLALVRSLCEGALLDQAEQRAWETEALAQTLLAVARDGDRALLRDERYARALGYAGALPCTAGELWAQLLEAPPLRARLDPDARAVLELILAQGCLARRIARRLRPVPCRAALEAVYRELCDCLARGELFAADPPGRRHPTQSGSSR
jgi:gamma-glutamyl:cysteine ligase YbdK (ATP-grasp superfamily)